MATYKVSLELNQREDGWWLVRCPAIRGLRAEGVTIGKALDQLPEVVQALWEACQEKGWVFVAGHPEAHPDNLDYITLHQ